MFKQIVIVEKSKIIREGISFLLQKNEICNKITEMEDANDWAMLTKNVVPDIVILHPDIAKDGIEKFRSKHQLSEQTLFIGIIYQYYNIKEISETFDEVIFITDTEEAFVNKFKLLFRQFKNETPANNEKLTDREKAVLRLLLRGLSNKEVAENLSISPHTVVSHRKNIIEKTGIRSLSGLAVYAILNNIADMDDLKQ